MRKILIILFHMFICVETNAQDVSYSEELVNKAEAGDVEAMNDLGKCYALGKEVPLNYSKAFYWFNIGAENGCAKAMDNLAWCYQYGYGVIKDYTKSYHWYKKAAENGLAKAMNDLAVCYNNGWGVEKNYSKAVYWYQKGAENGNDLAMCNLGICYITGNGIVKNYSSAINWFRKAAEKGNSQSMCNLGFCYKKGIGVSIDYDQSFYWFKKSSEKGNAIAMYNLGLCYENGWGVEKDYLQAIYEWKNAALLGNSLSILKLGYCYSYGEYGINADASKAEILYYASNEAKAGNIDHAINLVGKVFPYLVKNENTDNGCVNEADKIEEILSDVDVNIPQSNCINKNTFAVIIANENYQNEGKVDFALNDGRIFKKYCEETLGMPSKNIRFVENATLNNILMNIDWLKGVSDSFKDANIIFYYAGHGIPDEKTKDAYLLPVDGYCGNTRTGYKLDELYSELNSMCTKQTVVFLDACFSGAKRDGGMMSSARAVAISSRKPTPKGNIVVFSGAQADETAYPYKEKQHGLFTYFLLKKLQESKGYVTLGDLGSYIIDNVKQVSVINNDKLQTPSVNTAPGLNNWRNFKLK